MNKQLSLIAAGAALFLTVTPFAHAGTPSKVKKQRKTTQAAQVDYNTVVVRSTQPQEVTAGGEIGNDAPHQERNPSAHPELFQYTR